MPENADSWKCNKVVDQGKVAKYARCKLICQEGYDLSKSKRRDFHICKRTGSWMTTENVILSCKPNGDFFAEKLRIAMNQIQSFEVDIESLTRLVQKMETETDQCQEESEKCTEEKEIWTEKYDSLKTDLQECSSNRHDSLQPAGHVGISVIRRVENARETDTCIGTETNSGKTNFDILVLNLNLPFLKEKYKNNHPRIHPIYHFFDFSSKMRISALKMKILKFHGLQPKFQDT